MQGAGFRVRTNQASFSMACPTQRDQATQYLAASMHQTKDTQTLHGHPTLLDHHRAHNPVCMLAYPRPPNSQATPVSTHVLEQPLLLLGRLLLLPLKALALVLLVVLLAPRLHSKANKQSTATRQQH